MNTLFVSYTSGALRVPGTSGLLRHDLTKPHELTHCEDVVVHGRHELDANAPFTALMTAMNDHILAVGELVGLGQMMPQ